MDTEQRFSPAALFLSLGAIGLGAALAARHPGSRALFVVDWAKLFLFALPATALLFVVERLLSRAHRREEPEVYPYPGAVVLGLFGLAIALLALLNGQLPHATRSVRPVVRGWLLQEQAIPTMFGVPESQSSQMRAKRREGYVAVEAWWDRETQLRLPVTPDQVAESEEPGAHAVELVVADGALGIEYVEAVRVVKDAPRGAGP
jgi:hypothetical protein